MNSRVVVVGGSLAGVRAVEGIRDGGFDGQVVLVEESRSVPVVDRPQLSKAFLLDAAAPKLLPVRGDVAGNLEVRAPARAVHLDLGAGTVGLSTGESLAFDGMVIATGVSPRRIPDLDAYSNVYYLRTADDATALRSAVAGSQSVAIVGGGVLGCELAATCRNLGKEVALVESLDGLMLRSLGPAGAKLVHELHQRSGVAVHLGHPVARWHGDGRVTSLDLADETHIDADVVVVAIGAAPCTDWLSESGLTVDDGLVCDDALVAAGTDNVVGAGDVVRRGGTRKAGGVRVEHWTNAAQQGSVAGKNLSLLMRGKPVEQFREISYFWSDQFDWKIQMFGRPSHIADLQPEASEDNFVLAYHDDVGRPVGVMAVNAARQLLRWRSVIASAQR